MNAIPDISVIVASKNGHETIEECLKSIERQKGNHLLEIIVVTDNSKNDTSQIIIKRFPGVKLIVFARSTLIPDFWSAGIEAASGEIIAITIAQCVPTNNWISKIIESLNRSYSAVGGAIENSKTSSFIDWAVYFCRYSNYMPPFGEREVIDMAGDNAAYKREALEPYKEIIKRGFWENIVNAALITDELKILLTPDIVTVYKNSYGIISFLIQRFFHGYHYGNKRLVPFPMITRFMFTLASPLIPFIHLYRIAQRVTNRNRHLRELILSLPILFIFLLCWSVGEYCGYISGIFKERESP